MAGRGFGTAEAGRATAVGVCPAIRKDRALRSFGGPPDASGAGRTIVGDSSAEIGASTRRKGFTTAGIVTAPRRRARACATGQAADAAGTDDVSSGTGTVAGDGAGRASGRGATATGSAPGGGAAPAAATTNAAAAAAGGRSGVTGGCYQDP
jgi:hypothetical protein